jgi:5'-methylthioadenosine phosphorylase
MKAEVAIIGGVGFDIEGLADEIETPYGKVRVAYTRFKGLRVAFISRHGENHLPPHKVNYRAIICAARKSGALNVISINTVGSMAYHPLGSIFLPVDFVEFTKSRPNTFFEEKAIHVDMSTPYCAKLRSCLISAIQELGFGHYDGVYVCAEGPHLESPAQIRMMRQFGDVVGMTGYPEVVLAKEAGLCYASLCIVTNPACGMAGELGLRISDISDLMKSSNEVIRDVLYLAVQKILKEGPCTCGSSLSAARL